MLQFKQLIISLDREDDDDDDGDKNKSLPATRANNVHSGSSAPVDGEYHIKASSSDNQMPNNAQPGQPGSGGNNAYPPNHAQVGTTISAQLSPLELEWK